MKSGLLFLAALLCLNVQVQAKKATLNICEQLLEQADQECDEAMCSDQGEEECVRDGDFGEGKGICIYDDVLPRLIKEYNKANPKNKIGCEDGLIVEPPATATFSCSSTTNKARFTGEIFDNKIIATIQDPSKELEIKELKQTQSNVEFSQVIRKKEDTYKFSKFYNDFNTWQGLEFAFPKEVVSGDQTGKFTGLFIVYDDNGDIMAPGEPLSLNCRAY